MVLNRGNIKSGKIDEREAFILKSFGTLIKILNLISMVINKEIQYGLKVFIKLFQIHIWQLI